MLIIIFPDHFPHLNLDNWHKVENTNKNFVIILYSVSFSKVLQLNSKFIIFVFIPYRWRY